jgi:hypothetical protein
MWANEQEAAALSGFSPEQFRAALPKLEEAGFPRKNSWNGSRFIPMILSFWARQVDSAVPSASESTPFNILDFEDDHESQRITTG